MRFLNCVDLDGDGDGDTAGEVEPLIPGKDQINATTFALHMAQTYAAHRQRWATGVAVPEDENISLLGQRAR